MPQETKILVVIDLSILQMLMLYFALTLLKCCLLDGAKEDIENEVKRCMDIGKNVPAL